MAYVITAIQLDFDPEAVAKVSPSSLKHRASESIDVLEYRDKTREKAVYYAQFSWEEVSETGRRTLYRPAGQSPQNN